MPPAAARLLLRRDDFLTGENACRFDNDDFFQEIPSLVVEFKLQEQAHMTFAKSMIV